MTYGPAQVWVGDEQLASSARTDPDAGSAREIPGTVLPPRGGAVTTSVMASAIALVTVSGHAILAAWTSPSEALRYE